MELLAWSQNLTEARAAEVGARRVAKDELLAGADFVTIHLRLSPRTRGLIGARELGLMRKDAYLINTSRGPIVDEAALIGALEQGRIAGAALDVYDQEPLPAGHPLRRTPNLLLTPHIGYVTRETYRVFYGETVELVEAFLAGRPRNLLTGDTG
jgi:phosphoglycerate dehydrogenase-like enzyme